MDTHTRQITLDGRPVPLGERDFDLLLALAAAPGTVVDAATLLQRVWPGRVVEENTLHVHIAALRRLLGADAIRTVRGRGYQLTLPPDATPEPAVHVDMAAPATVPGNLPRAPWPLIGRSADLQALLQQMARHRAVTVTGPGGVGKTTLALAAGRESARPGGAGVWLVELAGADGAVPPAELVAQALGIELPGLQEADDELIDVLRTRSLRLVLDNCEHRVPETRRFIDRLLRDTEGVTVLGTSQVPLQHAGEQVYRLGALAVPPAHASADEARAAGALVLFDARLAGRGFPLALDGDPQALADAVAICERLDGLPLALELAAARVPLLGLHGLRQRLSEPLMLLGGGPPHAPARQQTLRAAIAWSHALLDDDERRAFRGLGIFPGSFSLALARRVLGLPDDDEGPALDLLGALLDKSLLVPALGGPDATGQPAAAPRLRLLESTRAYAREQLLASGEQGAMGRRLALAMLQLLGRDDGPRSLDEPGADMPPLAADLDNLRAALDHLAAQQDQALLHVELAGATAWVWSRLGLRAEGLRRSRQALARVAAQTPPRLEARLQLGWATLVHRRGEDGDSEAAARAAALYEGLGDRLGRFRALSTLAFMQALDRREDDCFATLEQLAESFDASWGPLQWGAYCWTMGACLCQFDRFDEAQAVSEQALSYMDMVASDGIRALGWVSAAQLASMREDFDLAVVLARRGLESARRARARGRVGTALGDLAFYLVAQGRSDEALPLAREAVALRAQDGTLGLLLDQLACLAAARGLFREAAMALGRAEVHHRRRNGRRERYLQGPHERATARVAAALPPDERRQWEARGAAMGDDEMARLTLRDGPGALDAPWRS